VIFATESVQERISRKRLGMRALGREPTYGMIEVAGGFTPSTTSSTGVWLDLSEERRVLSAATLRALLCSLRLL
jgi:hypothetical protein